MIKMTDIKAPDALKRRTLALMKKTPANSRRPWVPAAAAAVCSLVLAGLFVFGGRILPGQTAVGKDEQTAASNQQNEAGKGGQGSAPQLSADNVSPMDSASGVVYPEPGPLVPYRDKPSTDHTSADDIAAIKAAFSTQCPLTSYTVSYAYNDFQENGKPLHPRIDMSAPEGTEIYPLCDGTVLEAGYSAKVGRYLVIDHGDGLVSSYNHCKELLVNEGDTVSAASVIATVGKTGMATGPFLAFSVTWNEKPINPEALFD